MLTTVGIIGPPYEVLYRVVHRVLSIALVLDVVVEGLVKGDIVRVGQRAPGLADHDGENMACASTVAVSPFVQVTHGEVDCIIQIGSLEVSYVCYRRSVYVNADGNVVEVRFAQKCSEEWIGIRDARR